MLRWVEPLWSEFLLNAALKSTVVLTMAWILAKLLRGRSAAARHLVWTAAAAAVLALPFLAVGLPELKLPVNMPGLTFRTSVTAGAEQAAPAMQAAPGAAATANSAHSAPWHPDWPLCLMCLWAAGTLFSLSQTTFAAWALARARRKAEPFAAEDFSALANRLGMEHAVPVLESSPGSMPMTFGLWRPAIFLPADAVEWPEERRHLVVLHELAHVLRGDVATHVLARTALSFYWWNPLAWLAWREFLKEREHAADDVVLRCGARASDYAGHLLAVAQAMQPAAAIGWAAVAMARRSQLEGRLLAILDSGVNRTAIGRTAAAGAALAAVLLVAPLAAIRAQDQSGTPTPAQTRLASATQIPNQTGGQGDGIRLRLDVTSAVQSPNETGEEYGARLAKLGDTAMKNHQDTDAIDLYTKAVSVLGDHPSAVHSLLSLGVLYMEPRELGAQRQIAKAAEYFERVQSADPSRAGEALMWQGVAYGSEKGEAARAESYFRSALSLQGTSSPQAAVTMDLLARLLRSQGRTAEAGQMAESVASIRQALGAQMTQVVRSPDAVHAGGGVRPPLVAHKSEPEYSAEAKAAKYQGTVMLYVEIGPDGLAHNIQVTQPLGLGLDEKAVEAVSQWRFKPGTQNGQPVTVAATIEVNFRLL